MSTKPFRVNRHATMSPEERRQDRWAVEQAKLRRYFPSFHLVRNDTGRVCACVGFLTPRTTRYGVRVEIPRGYPYEMPALHAAGWSPATGTPHRYSDGNLCVMKPDQWSANYTLAFFVAKAALWLNKYEVWLDTGKWPGNDQDRFGASGGFVDILREIFDL